MKIRSLTMKGYRGFGDATLDLDRPLTVLFGVNVGACLGGMGFSPKDQTCDRRKGEDAITLNPLEHRSG